MANKSECLPRAQSGPPACGRDGPQAAIHRRPRTALASRPPSGIATKATVFLQDPKIWASDNALNQRILRERSRTNLARQIVSGPPLSQSWPAGPHAHRRQLPRTIARNSISHRRPGSVSPGRHRKTRLSSSPHQVPSSRNVDRRGSPDRSPRRSRAGVHFLTSKMQKAHTGVNRRRTLTRFKHLRRPTWTTRIFKTTELFQRDTAFLAGQLWPPAAGQSSSPVHTQTSYQRPPATDESPEVTPAALPDFYRIGSWPV